MCFVWIWEQTAIISLYSINWLVCITETECVHCTVRTGSLYIIQVMCFVWIWEQTAIISLCSINWLVCITETECVYCAVRARYLSTMQANLPKSSALPAIGENRIEKHFHLFPSAQPLHFTSLHFTSLHSLHYSLHWASSQRHTAHRLRLICP
jgi:hypothetical protein